MPTIDDYGFVLCPHGRAITCLECGEEYARELARPEHEPIRTACDDCLDARRKCEAERAELLGALRLVLSSGAPNQCEHPAMWDAWQCASHVVERMEAK